MRHICQYKTAGFIEQLREPRPCWFFVLVPPSFIAACPHNASKHVNQIMSERIFSWLWCEEGLCKQNKCISGDPQVSHSKTKTGVEKYSCPILILPSLGKIRVRGAFCCVDKHLVMAVHLLIQMHSLSLYTPHSKDKSLFVRQWRPTPLQ